MKIEIIILMMIKRKAVKLYNIHVDKKINENLILNTIIIK